MADAFNPQNFVNSADKTPIARITDVMAGSARITSDPNAPVNATTMANALVNGGTTAGNGADIVNQSIDALQSTGTGPYTTDTNPARASAEDINRSRIAGIYDARDYVPSTRIQVAKNEGRQETLHALDDVNVETMPSMGIRFAKYERPNPFVDATFRTEFRIVLPLPTELTDMVASRWNPSDLGTVGDLANLFGGGANAYEGSSAATAGALALNASQTLISAAGRTLASRAPGPLAALGSVVSSQSENLATILQQAVGVAPNPNPSMTFSGPQLRQYTYSWMFHPNNADESDRIMRIIQELKKRSLPSTFIGATTALLKYPQMCLINLYPWDQAARGTTQYGHALIKYKKSVITSVNVSYSPNGVPSFFGDNNQPAFIGLSISFSEIEFFTARDFGAGDGTGSLTDLVTGLFDTAEGVQVQGDNVLADNATVLQENLKLEQAAGENTNTEGDPAGGEQAPQ